ncbi:MAG: hypothetical protein QW478_06065 [Candidatus Micrarchaeaceae archaeon]
MKKYDGVMGYNEIMAKLKADKYGYRQFHKLDKQIDFRIDKIKEQLAFLEANKDKLQSLISGYKKEMKEFEYLKMQVHKWKNK